MKVVLMLIAVCILTAGLSGCYIVDTPARGWIFTEIKYGNIATTSTASAKEGKACAQSILGMVATGDASIAAAKAAGGITEVSYVDHYAKNILGIVGDWCTIVRGK